MAARTSRRLTTTAALTASLLSSAMVGSALASTHYGFSGSAYGSKGSAGSTASTGRSALVPLCTTRTGVAHSNKATAIQVPGMGTIGAVTTRVSSRRLKHGGVESLSTTHTAATTLAGGEIHVSAIDTSARVSRSATAYAHSVSTTLVGFTVDGHAMPEHPSKDQTMSIPGVGKAVLNQQSSSTRNGIHSASVTALVLTVPANNTAGLPGGKFVVGHSMATLHAPIHRVAYGNAYGTAVQGGDATSGRSAPSYIPCAGSDGKVHANSTGRLTQAGALSSAAISSTAKSTDSAAATTATTGARITHLNLLGGAITASMITARAHAVRKHGRLTRSDAGTTVGGLSIQGKSYPAAEPTKRTLSGIGTLYVDRVIRTKNGLQVYALELVLSKAQDGLSKGTALIAGAARAGVEK